MGKAISRITHSQSDYMAPDSHDLTALVTGRGATLVVAASDSLNKAQADYQCDGTADEVEIQAAIDTLPGIVFLLAGNYIAKNIVLSSRVSLLGEGRQSSIIKNYSATNEPTLTITASPTLQYFRVHGLGFDKDTGATPGVHLAVADALYGSIRDCFFAYGDKGIELDNSYRITVQDCNFMEQVYDGIGFKGLSTVCTVINCNVADAGRDGYRVEANCNDIVFIGCGGSAAVGTTDYYFELVGAKRTTLINCDSTDNNAGATPVALRSACQNITIIGGVLAGASAGNYGLWINSASDVTVMGTEFASNTAGSIGIDTGADILLMNVRSSDGTFLDGSIPTSLMQIFTPDASVLQTGKLGLRSPTELTISGGAITVTQSYHSVDTEGDDPSDDLDTISGGVTGDILTLRAAVSTRTVVCKDGTGNLLLAGDFSLDHDWDTIMLICADSYWRELSRADNG